MMNVFEMKSIICFFVQDVQKQQLKISGEWFGSKIVEELLWLQIWLRKER